MKMVNKSLVFNKLKARPSLSSKAVKFNELKIIPKMKIREKPFYKCITQF